MLKDSHGEMLREKHRMPAFFERRLGWRERERWRDRYLCDRAIIAKC